MYGHQWLSDGRKHWEHHLDLLCCNSTLIKPINKTYYMASTSTQVKEGWGEGGSYGESQLDPTSTFPCRSVYGKAMVMPIPKEIAQFSWHYISHCKFAFLCKYSPRDSDYSVSSSPASAQRYIPSLSAGYIKPLRWKQSFRPRTLENSSKQMPPCFPDDTSDRTACPLFSDIYSYMWLS